MATNPTPSGGGLCLNCDNRHGCRSARPPCQELQLRSSEGRLSGRQLMLRRGLLGRCRVCELFRRCWTTEDYLRQARGGSAAK